MKTRFLMLLAAMLLGTASAFAQSGNNEPMKGDVNGDGKVDVADITAVIKIMKDGGGTSEETKCYYYVGTEKPTSLSQASVVESYPAEQTFTNPSTTEKCYVYVLTKADMTVNFYDPSDLTTAATKTEDTSSISGYKITNMNVRVGKGGSIIIKISPTYYWYVGHENPMNMTSITPLPSNDASEGAGWRTIGTTLPTYTKNDPLWNNNMYGTISTASSKSTQYMALPSIDIKSRNDITGEDITSDGWNNVGTKILNNVTYIVYSSVNTKKSFMDTLY